MLRVVDHVTYLQNNILYYPTAFIAGCRTAQTCFTAVGHGWIVRPVINDYTYCQIALDSFTQVNDPSGTFYGLWLGY